MNGGGVKAPEAEVEPLKESCESLQQACNFLVVIPAGDLRQDPDKPSINKLPQLVLPNEEAVVIINSLQDANAAMDEIESLLASGVCDVPCKAYSKMEGGRMVPWLRVIGFDTETKPQFRAGQKPNPVALVKKFVILCRLCA